MYKNENWRQFKRKWWLMFIDTILEFNSRGKKKKLSSQTQGIGDKGLFYAGESKQM